MTAAGGRGGLRLVRSGSCPLHDFGARALDAAQREPLPPPRRVAEDTLRPGRLRSTPRRAQAVRLRAIRALAGLDGQFRTLHQALVTVSEMAVAHGDHDTWANVHAMRMLLDDADELARRLRARATVKDTASNLGTVR